VSVTAIEFCEIYILDFIDLRKYLQINETIMHKLTETANDRMEMILRCEEAFEKQLKENINSVQESFSDDESNK
jgi:CRP-like cAMP-binding protein